MSTKKIVLITSSDGVSFEVDEAVAYMSQTIANMLKDNEGNNAIKLFNVTGEILAKVIEYCKKHVDVVDKDVSFSSKEEVKNWDAEFVKLDIIELAKAAHFLDIKSLLDLTCQTLADMFTAKYSNDFTPAEEQIIRQEIYGLLNNSYQI